MVVSFTYLISSKLEFKMSIKIVPITTIKTKEWLTSYKERSIILIAEFFDNKYINLKKKLV